MGSSKMDTYVEPEIEEVQGPMDEDDMKMDACGCQENISMHGNLFLSLYICCDKRIKITVPKIFDVDHYLLKYVQVNYGVLQLIMC